MKSQSLYELEQNYLSLVEMMEDDPENEDINNILSIAESEIYDKSENYCKLIKSRETDILGIDSEIKRLQALKKSKQSLIDRLKDSIHGAMELTGTRKLDLGLFKVSLRKSEPVQIDDDFDRDSEYNIHKTTISPDKKAIKEAIKSGIEIKGASLVSKESLQIK